MTNRDIRGYVVAVALLSFSGAWAVTAHETPRPAGAQRDALVTRRERLEERAAQLEAIIAGRRAATSDAPAVQVLSVPGQDSVPSPPPSTTTRSS